MSVDRQLRQSLGTLQYMALRRLCATVHMVIDPDDRTITIQRNGKEPIRVSFRDVEKFVNDAH